jgi:hypothetical protein
MGIHRGTTRPDGKMFWAYRYRYGKKTEIWIKPEQYQRRENTRIAYARNRNNKMREKIQAVPLEERNHVGKYCPEKGLYFLRSYVSGNAVYGTLEELKAFRLKQKKRNRNYLDSCKERFPLPNLSFGDQHPNDPNLFVVAVRRNKLFFGTREQYESKRQRLNESYKKYKQKNREIIKIKNKKITEEKTKFLNENPHLKRFRGDIDPLFNKIFWGYSSIHNEVWLKPDVYHQRRLRANKRTSLLKKNKKLLLEAKKIMPKI